MEPIVHLSSISDLTNLANISLQHPLVSIIDFSKVDFKFKVGTKMKADFYQIDFKNYCPNQITYGREKLDFQDGSLICIVPHQIVTIENEVEKKR